MRGTPGAGASRPDDGDAARLNGASVRTDGSLDGGGVLVEARPDTGTNSSNGDGERARTTSVWSGPPPRHRRGVPRTSLGPTADLFPPGLANRPRRGRRVVLAITIAVAVVAASLGVWSMVGRSTPAAGAASTAVTNAVRTTVASHTAQLAVTMRVRIPGSGVADATGSGVVDVTTDASQIVLTFRDPGALAGQRLQEVFAGNNSYLSIPQLDGVVAGKPWVKQSLAPGAVIAPGNSDPVAALGMLASPANRVDPLGASTIDGSPVHAYLVTVSAASLRSGLAGAGLPTGLTRAAEEAVGTRPDVVTVDVNDATRTVSRLVTDVDLSLGTHPVVAAVTEDFHGYGLRVAIAPPPAGQVISLPQLQAAVKSTTSTLST
jgi:hypothetical protein